MKKLLTNEAFAVLKFDSFRVFLFYRFFMTAATLMQSVIVGWHLYSLTHNVLSLGLIGLAEVVPQVGIALFAGHFVDLWDRKKIIAFTSLIVLLGSAILVVYSIPSFNGFETFGTAPIFITFFLTGLARGILMPAHSAFMSQLIPKDLYANGATWNSATWHIAAVVGPAIGGLVYGFYGIVNAYITIFGIYLIAFLLIVKIKSVRMEVERDPEEGIFSRIHDGIKYVFKSQALLGAFSLDMFAVLFGGAVALLPVFASEILKVGPEGLGLLRACPAIGAIIMSGFLMFYPPVHNAGKLLFTAVTGFGLCMIAFALSHNFYLSAIILILSGSFDNISVVIRGTILQLFTPNEMRGRVAAVNSIFIGSSNELGAFESGVAARILGLVPSVIFGGSMTLAVAFTTFKISPVLRKLKLK